MLHIKQGEQPQTRHFAIEKQTLIIIAFYRLFYK